MQGRCEQLEKETDWAKAERDEASKAAEAAAERVRELEAAAGRQKGQRRDDTKKAVKEGRAATQRAEVRLQLELLGSLLMDYKQGDTEGLLTSSQYTHALEKESRPSLSDCLPVE